MDDLNEIVNLLMVSDKARQWPALQSLHDAAMRQLLKLQVGVKENMDEEAKKAMEEEAKKVADKAAADKAAADKAAAVEAKSAVPVFGGGDHAA